MADQASERRGYHPDAPGLIKHKLFSLDVEGIQIKDPTLGTFDSIGTWARPPKLFPEMTHPFNRLRCPMSDFLANTIQYETPDPKTLSPELKQEWALNAMRIAKAYISKLVLDKEELRRNALVRLEQRATIGSLDQILRLLPTLAGARYEPLTRSEEERLSKAMYATELAELLAKLS